MPIPNLSGATWPAQAEPDSIDFEIISAAANAYGVASGCACTPGNAGVNLSVAVASGSVHVGTSTPVAVTGTSVTPGAAHATNPRFDLITVNTSGVVSVVAGTAAAAPEYPAIPAGRTVLAAVYIPATATSITAANIVDKRQLLNRTPQLGTTSTTAAAGDHVHSGQYASTLHADTHRADGSDPITELANFTVYPNDGTGIIKLQGQSAGWPAAMPDDGKLGIFAAWLGFRPTPAVRSIDRWMPFGDEITGPGNIWRVQANTGSTAPPNGSIPHTTSGTFSTPTATTALGFRQITTTGTTAGNTAFIATTDARWTRGNDGRLPWCGYYFHARVAFESAAYSSSRIYIGLTNQTAATALAADDPAGHRHMFKVLNGTGNWLLSVKDGTTETTTDTGIAFATGKVYDLYIFIRPWGGYAFGGIHNVTDDTMNISFLHLAGSPPGDSIFMRAMAGIVTTNTTAKGMSFHRIGCETSV